MNKNEIASLVQELLIGKKSNDFRAYLSKEHYYCKDLTHLGIYDTASIIVDATENYIKYPGYYKEDISLCLIHILINKDFIQIR